MDFCVFQACLIFMMSWLLLWMPKDKSMVEYNTKLRPHVDNDDHNSLREARRRVLDLWAWRCYLGFHRSFLLFYYFFPLARQRQFRTERL